MAEQKKYWIKLEKDFLNSSQIKVIKNLPNGKDYIIFYLAIMLESTNSEGHLRFSELVPYNEEMLASVTDTNVDIVRSAMKIFQNLGLLQVLENGTIFLPDVPKRVGKESESAERVRMYRARQNLLQCNAGVTNCNDNKDKEKDKEKDKDKDKKKDKEKEVEQGSMQAIITIPLNDNSEFAVTQEMIDEYEKLYGNVNVLQELKNMRGWALANVKKRKTRSGVLRFINSWLSGSQNRGSFNGYNKTQPKEKCTLYEDVRG